MTLLTHVLTHIGDRVEVNDEGTSVRIVNGYATTSFNTAETEQLVEALVTWLEGRGVRRFKVV